MENDYIKVQDTHNKAKSHCFRWNDERNCIEYNQWIEATRPAIVAQFGEGRLFYDWDVCDAGHGYFKYCPFNLKNKLKEQSLTTMQLIAHRQKQARKETKENYAGSGYHFFFEGGVSLRYLDKDENPVEICSYDGMPTKRELLADAESHKDEKEVYIEGRIDAAINLYEYKEYYQYDCGEYWEVAIHKNGESLVK